MINWVKRVSRKFGNAMKGMVVMIREEKSLWVHLFFSIIVVIAGIVLFDPGSASKTGDGDALWQWIAITIAITMVIGFEIINTSIEYLVDIVSFEYDVKAKKIKDVAAMATLVVTIGAIIIGLIVFIPEISEAFSSANATDTLLLLFT